MEVKINWHRYGTKFCLRLVSAMALSRLNSREIRDFWGSSTRFWLSHPFCAGEEGLCFVVVLKIYFSDFCPTNYLNIFTKFVGLVKL